MQRETGRGKQKEAWARAERNREPKRSPPTPPLGSSPSRRGDHKGQTPVHGGHVPTGGPRRGVVPAAAGSREGPASPPSPAVPPSAPLTIFLPAVSGPPLQDLSGPFKNGSAATSLPASAGARLSLPHLTTRLLRSARDGGRREARPKIQQNACASVPSAS